MAEIDLDQFDAALAEERLEPHRITFMGERFEIPNERLWDEELTGAIEANRLTAVFTMLLGADGYRRLREAGRRSRLGSLKLAHLQHIMDQIAAGQGLESLGESPAGVDSSATTGAPSNPISNASTGSASPEPSAVVRAELDRLGLGAELDRLAANPTAVNAAKLAAKATNASRRGPRATKPKKSGSPPDDSPG